MIRTTIAAAAVASAGIGLVMLAPDANESTLADGAEFINVDDDTALSDALVQFETDPGDAAVETLSPTPVTVSIVPAADAEPSEGTPEVAAPAARTTVEAGEDLPEAGDRRDGRRRGGRDARADR